LNNLLFVLIIISIEDLIIIIANNVLAMTYKNAKTILFASLLVAMILPFSMMSLADAAPGKNADEKSLKQQYEEVSQKYNTVLIAVQKLDSFETEKILTVSQAQDRLDKVAKMNELSLQADEIQRKNIEAHKMPAKIEEFLSNAEKLVEENVDDLTGVIVNGKLRTLVVYAQTDEAAQQAKELVGYVETKNTHLDIRVSTFNFSGCLDDDEECNPVMGRLQMEAENNGKCRIAVPYTDGTNEGFLTAGHCVDNSADKVYQPEAETNQIGDISDGTWLVSASQSCDCAWIDKRGTKTFSERIFDTGYSYGYSYYTIDDHNTPSVGTFVSMGEADGIVHAVEIIKYDEIEIENEMWTDMMYLDEGTDYGDSGGAVFGNITHDFHGIISGGDTSTTIASHWNNIETALGF